MKAKVGDWLVVKGTTVERSDLARGDHRGAFGGRLSAIHGSMAHHRPCGNCISRRGRGRCHVRGTGSGGRAGAVPTRIGGVLNVRITARQGRTGRNLSLYCLLVCGRARARFLRKWGGRGSNPRPTNYEPVGLARLGLLHRAPRALQWAQSSCASETEGLTVHKRVGNHHWPRLPVRCRAAVTLLSRTL